MAVKAASSRVGEPPLLELLKVTKQYPGVTALDGVDFTVRSGEVHVLFGENGAGKSTLISIVAGAIRPTSGALLMNGERLDLGSVHEARSKGITTVFQEFSLVPSMTVEENLVLGAEPTRAGLLDRQAIRAETRALLKRLDFDLSPTALVGDLSRAEQQMVEIARAFRSRLSVLILDEPTASLTDREADRLFELVAQAKADGVGVVYITHRLREIERIADRITVLRDGHYIKTIAASEADEETLVRLMTGRAAGAIFPEIKADPKDVALSIENLSTASGSVRDASFEVRGGEVVGLAGLVGSGKSEAVRAAFGLERVVAGSVTIAGRAVANPTPRRALDAGLLYLPPDRKNEGLAMMRPCRENMSLAALRLPPFAWGPWLNRRAEAREGMSLARRMDLHPMRPDRDVEAFSGGNQQKVLLARSLTRPVAVYAFDEPTVGVDVGARVAIYRFIKELCESGAAVVLISSDLPEILNLAHRALVFAGGRVQAELAGAELTEEAVLRHFFERRVAA
ncbi:sugar ABC transporter ATP-binding protein [Hansschlegelia quercus]|uniref:Sugar ABC transporter ATP-binding protein n=2 Tax=Hansschlegelia quercus TaxID=2528245 RepID=A0A4Q9GIW9_9HYPH|nr:sugar ABC transporter ATP-binding protein [Hansschlegelia quercus]